MLNVHLVFLTLAYQGPTSVPSTQLVESSPEAQWALNELTVIYAHPDQAESTLKKVFSDLASNDFTLRHIACGRIHSLFKQSLADESNGRCEWRSLPYFGGGAESTAHTFRKAAARQLAETALGDDSIEIAMWLILEDRAPENQLMGISALRKIKSPRVQDAFRAILSAPVHQQDVLKGVIEEAGSRGLNELSDLISPLCNDYRTSVRQTAIKQAPSLGLTPRATFQSEKAFTLWLQKELQDIAALVFTPILPHAAWCQFTPTEKPSRDADSTKSEVISGWLLDENATDFHVLTYFAEEITLKKSSTTRLSHLLKNEADKLRRLRGTSEEDRLSRSGGLTAQFEPSFISVPEALIAAWAFQRGDRATAAELIFPRYSEAPNEEWVKTSVRDMLGTYYQDLLLHALSYERNYTKALQLAQHLTRKPYDGYRYQPRAIELIEQLTRRRSEDFKTLTLPTTEEWKTMSRTLSRQQKIEYLAHRLRLLNCIQWGQPGGVSYQDEQTVESLQEAESNPIDRRRVINPYVELRLMKLDMRDLPFLTPFLADEDYMLTYSYWRDFHPSRTLHRTNWAAGLLVNSVAKRQLFDAQSYERLDKVGKKSFLDQISRWISQNNNKSPSQLLIDTLSATRDFTEFSKAAGEVIQNKDVAALPVILQRMRDFPNSQPELVEMCYRLNPGRVVSQARQWVKQSDPQIQLWAGLILLHSGDRSRQEGLDTVRSVLQQDKDGERFYPSAFEPLLATNEEPAIQLACEVLKIKSDDPSVSSQRDFMIHRLLLAGRQEALEFVLNALDDSSPSGTFNGDLKGKSVEQKLVIGDRMAQNIAEIRADGYQYDLSAPDEQRQRDREALKAWLINQIALIRQGIPSAIKTDVQPIAVIHGYFDAP